MVNEKGICVDRTYLYHTLCKTLIKKEKKKTFFNKRKNPIINKVR